jgi:hypothetical protein
MRFPPSLDPLVGINLGKRHLAMGVLINLSDHQTGEPSPGGSVDLTSARNKDDLGIEL